jgi:hypothetical protein
MRSGVGAKEGRKREREKIQLFLLQFLRMASSALLCAVAREREGRDKELVLHMVFLASL